MNSEQNWRLEALMKALQADAEDGNSISAIMREIYRYRPDATTLVLSADRLQLLRFLRTQASGLHDLVPGSSNSIQRDTLCPYMGWYAVEWEGIDIEIALDTGAYVTASIIVIADTANGLERFAKALDAFVTKPAGRCLRYSRQWESAPDLDAEIGKVTWDDIVLPPATMASIREGVEGFFQHRRAFETLGFAWRRGLLLVGPPGTGKTMVCRAAAAALPDLPFLYVRDFQAGHSPKDAMATIFDRARSLAPCLLAFEDIDGLVTQGNRTVFLNEMDGFQSNNGLLIIASSNHPDKIDEALLKRPSRFDRVFHIGLPALAERRTYCLRLLESPSLASRLAADFQCETLAQSVAERSDGFTPAYLKEAFVSAALSQAQSGAETLDAGFYDSVLAQVEELKEHLRRVQNPDAMGEFISPEAAPVGIRRTR